MFEPRIVCFFCKWCTYAGADLAGTSRKQYPPNGVVVRVNCSGRIDPQHVLWAFREGADAVLIGGCHPGDCHYQDGNYKTMRRISLLKRMLEDFGIEPERLRLEWISAAEGDKLVRVMNSFVEDVKELGPLTLDDRPLPKDRDFESPHAAEEKKAARKKAAGKKKAAKKTAGRKASAGRGKSAKKANSAKAKR